MYLGPLPINEIAYKYQLYLGVELEEAASLAKFTKGYAYAYQVL